MGNNEEGKSSKSDKSSSPAPPGKLRDQTNIHVYPDWAAMQAYYGPRVALPPYYNSAVASGHAPHPYMWGPPQPMMSPYGAPYAAIYSHGGIYAHPTVPLGSHAHGHGVPTSPAVNEALPATPMTIETPAKSSGNADRGLIKKLKGFDGLAMSIGNGNADSGEGRTDHGLSQSTDTEDSSDGSDGNTAGANQTGRKRSHEGTPTTGMIMGNLRPRPVQLPAREANATSDKVLGNTVAPSSAVGKLVGTVTALELRNASSMNAKTSPASVPQPAAVLPSDAWITGINERELKRERRKQSNRESARRSRLRKQAEAEELAVKVESLSAENITLKSEINRLKENSEKLRFENTTLVEKLKNARQGQTEEFVLKKVDDKRAQPVSTENLLSRVNNSGSVDRSPDEEGDMYENKKSGTKLHQLLDTSPRADACGGRLIKKPVVLQPP
ncbi:hypothetical protein L1049_014403 [Liquidambar formosana]|uniref:BZIP domain-containing protein n=1 Tax=Liquidambar formosana TaxID=63359 RepID=A0AAP0WZJ7_LIQFO